ncbi:MAG: potassium channel family protein [Planctomycetales bacterium]
MPAKRSLRRSPEIALARKAAGLVSMLAGLMVVGTVGLRIFTGGSWIDCLYMAVTTITTVGYGEIVPMTPAARMFIVVFLFAGFGLGSYSFFQIGQWVLSVEVRQLVEMRRMENKIDRLQNHYIVCGMGRMGRTICQQLSERSKPFVVIDVDEEKLKAHCADAGWLYLAGDSTNDQVLLAAGIDRARALATVLPTDADNVYVVLTARLLSWRLEIIARASQDAAALKLQRAGANRVVSPYSTGAEKMARFMLNPNIEDFLEIADNKGQDLELADVQIAADSPYVGKRLHETDLRELGVIIVGIRRKGGERLMPPPGNALIEAGDCLFVFGSKGSVNQMIGDSASPT